MNNAQLLSRLESLGTIIDFEMWLEETGYSLKEAWDNCHRGDWMLWLACQNGADIRKLTAAKVRFARLVQHLMKDERSINALWVAVRFSKGEATLNELYAARISALDALKSAKNNMNAISADTTIDDDVTSVCTHDAAHVAYRAASAAFSALDVYKIVDVAEFIAKATSGAVDVVNTAAGIVDYESTDKIFNDILLKCANICHDIFKVNQDGDAII